MKTFWTLIALLSFLVLTGCMTSGGTKTRVDNIPMYGQPEIVRPDALKQADQDFIAKVEKELGSREEASKRWWAQAERFMNQGNIDYAMRRYNQSWLLDPNNYQPYWGFARVMLEQGKLDQGLKYLEKAEELINDNFQKVALLSDMATAYTYKGKADKSYFLKANNKFKESIKIDPKYPDSWRRWAYSLYEQGNYSEALKKVEKAKSLNARPFSPDFISSLNTKLGK